MEATQTHTCNDGCYSDAQIERDIREAYNARKAAQQA